MFRAIESTEALPSPGSRVEGSTLDFKAKLSADAFEIAKDVAAFANVDGGTLLVGATRHGEFLAGYAPLSRPDASATQRAIEEAVRDRCRPAPVVNVVPIESGEGFVVAANVWPFPGQLVGVEIKKSDAKFGPKQREIEGLYYYPRRVGAHTRAITPEQVPMFIDPKVRRVAIALADAVGKRIVLSAPHEPRTKDRPGADWMTTAQLDELDVPGNAIQVTVPTGKGTARIAIPFDLIVSAWRDDGVWHALIRGTIDEMEWFGDIGEPELQRKRVILQPKL